MKWRKHLEFFSNKTMKFNKFKFLKSAVLVGTLALATVASAITPNHFTERGITGTYLCLSNSAGVSGGASFALGASSNFWYYSYAAGTNVLVGSTNNAGILASSPIGDLPIYPDANVDINPTLALQVVLGYTNQLFLTGVQSPVMINTVWTNPVPVFTNSAVQTNTVVITVVPVSSGEFGLADTASKGFSFTVIQTNQIPITVTTNLPNSLLQGSYSLRWSATNTATGTGQGVIFNALNLTGWKP